MGENVEPLADRFNSSLISVFKHIGPKLFESMDLDLTPGQVFMMNFIQKEKETISSHLAELLEVNSSAITVMLDRLENHGFIERKRSKEDRRVIVISLTPFGEENLNSLLKKRNKAIEHCLNQLGKSEAEIFIESLEKLATISSHMDFPSIVRQNNKAE